MIANMYASCKIAIYFIIIIFILFILLSEFYMKKSLQHS